MKRLLVLLVLSILIHSVVQAQSSPPSKGTTHTLRFEISFPAQLSRTPLDGRMMLGLSTDEKQEPRMHFLEEEVQSQQFFAVDVNDLAPGEPAVIDASALGYPARSLADIPAGDYYVQALLNRYQTYHRADGYTVKLPPDMGEGQQWNQKPGNLYSKPVRMHIDPHNGSVIHISLTEKIPPVEPVQDSKYVKRIRIQSKLLTKFWGTPMYLGAHVLLPEGFDTHPNAHYPIVVYQDHFSRDLRFFRSEPPAREMKGREREWADAAYKMYQDWTSGRLPHVIIVDPVHPNPYYDDSYAVNSANVGPYGDAITQELIPAIEQEFRGIGQPWARVLIGGSTGGWEALADQVFYPDYFNGAWSFCPDPVDFHAYQAVDIYNDKNAFWAEGKWGRVPRPEMRDTKGNLLATMEPTVRREEVLGTHGRSTDQFGIWQAVFSPVGSDGYPKPIWNPATGVIDPEVANYWRDHYDLTHIMERDWATLGPKLAGKLHFAVGDMDTWYLNNAVHRLEDFLRSEKNIYKVPDFNYGAGKPHCYTGGPFQDMWQRVLPAMRAQMKATAPKGADLSWDY
jgi:enterochelin esterase-like enzyme